MQDNLSEAKKLLKLICEEHRPFDDLIMQGVDGEEKHGLEVLHWVEQLTTNTSLELEIAALFHDIDRVVTPKKGGGFQGDRKSQAYLQHKKGHAQRSANYIIPKLQQLGFDQRTLDRIAFLILHHDDTGVEVEEIADPDLNILVAADTFAFFTTIGPKLLEIEGIERLKDKIRFMIEKMPENLRIRLRALKIRDDNMNQAKNEMINEYFQTHTSGH